MRCALVTGASSGIGAALAMALAGPDAVLHLGGRDAARLEAVAEACRARGARAHTRIADVRDEGAIAAWVREAGAAGHLDLVVANAGISAGTGISAGEEAAQARLLFAVNLGGVLNTVLPALEVMEGQARGEDGRRGTIAAIASIAAFIPAPGAPAYAASKAAVDAWVLGHRPAAWRRGIHLASVCPGFIATPMTAGNPYRMPGIMPAERAARIILRGLARGHARVAFPWWLAALARGVGVLPAPWALALLGGFGGKPALGEQGLRNPRQAATSEASNRGPTVQNINSGIHHLTVGNATVTALNDLVFEAGTGVVAGLPATEAEAVLRAGFRRMPARISVSSYLVSIGEQHILIDTGVGAMMGAGQVRPRLARLGIEPASVATILVTHAHPDHVGGLIDDNGGAYFPNAQLVMHEAEVGFWLDDAKAEAAPEGLKGSFEAARKALAPYRARIKTVKDGQEGAPGLRAQLLPGHTPGHCGWLLEQGNDTLFIWGDIVHLPGLQFREPKAGMVYDVDLDQARATRMRAFDRVTTDKLRVCGMHHDFPTFGHVVKAAEGYHFLPEVWMPTA